MTETSITHINNALYNIDWTQLNNMNVEDSATRLSDIILQVLNLFTPTKKLIILYKNLLREPWMTKDILRLSRTREHKYKLSKSKSKTSKAYHDYLIINAEFNKAKFVAKQNYYTEEL